MALDSPRGTQAAVDDPVLRSRKKRKHSADSSPGSGESSDDDSMAGEQGELRMVTDTRQPQPQAAASSSATPAAATEYIPTHFIPSMFVPYNDDLTRPFDDAPRSRLDRARATLCAIDEHRTGVRRGLVHLGLLDQQRILAHPRLRTDTDEERDPDLMGPGEADRMLSTMSMPATPGYDYSVKDDQMAQPIPLFWPPAEEERPGGRREAVRAQQMVVEQVLAQIALYEGHSSAVRVKWTGAFEREQKRLRAQFGPDELTDAGKTAIFAGGSSADPSTEKAAAAAQPAEPSSTTPTTTTAPTAAADTISTPTTTDARLASLPDRAPPVQLSAGPPANPLAAKSPASKTTPKLPPPPFPTTTSPKVTVGRTKADEQGGPGR